MTLRSGAAGGEQRWRDLAGNEPGRAARARADELAWQAPVRCLLAWALGLRTEERDYRVGADGEEMVARRLRALDARWHVVHAVPVGRRGADIDHVVIGPPGVFTLNTKHHPRGRVWVGQGSVVVNGRSTAYVRAARLEGSRAARLLGAACGFRVDVRPVLVVVGARLVVRRQPLPVTVVDVRTLVGWLRRQPAVLGPDAAAQIFELARRDTSWLPPAP